MKNVLKLNKLGALADQVFGANYKLHDAHDAPDAVIVRSFSMQAPYVLPQSVQCIARAGAGTNNIPSKDYAEKGVVVFNTPGANANAVKELCICALFLAGRKIVDGINWTGGLKEGDPSVAQQVEKGKGNFVGGEILGKNIGIIGLGAIGMLTAEAAAALGMKVFAYAPRMTPEKQAKLYKCITLVKTLDELYEKCQFISLHLPFIKGETEKMINAEVLKKCKDGVNIINCARAELVDNDAIIDGLKSGKVNRYVTDFPVGTVLNIPGIITIPHLGASTPEAEDNCVSMGGAQIIDFMENGNIVNSVNYPALSLAKTPKTDRMTICFKGALDIKKLAEKAGVKIANFATASKGDFGYAIIDYTEKCNCDEVKKIDGVLRVRCV